MDGKLLIEIRDENGSIEQEFQFDNYRQFRLLWFDKEGQPRILGKLPLKTIKRSSKRWAEDWASEQDLAKARATLVKDCPRISMEALLESTAHGAPIRQGIQQDYGEKDGAVIFAILWPMFTALLRRLKQAMMKPVTTWQFTQSTGAGTGSILNWLFRRQNGNGS